MDDKEETRFSNKYKTVDIYWCHLLTVEPQMWWKTRAVQLDTAIMLNAIQKFKLQDLV